MLLLLCLLILARVLLLVLMPLFGCCRIVVTAVAVAVFVATAAGADVFLVAVVSGSYISRRVVSTSSSEIPALL